ncbi:MAG: bifunctional glutamate N-acetyltransferase/amino-acid acetyltransferase ArgJ [Syntrophales bacterium]|nr:bifunctional glutamate N-acetyltransferase/amino-acid acetyltransferase ArgJ [Syntrophales bacterium]MDD5641087.1 bifunctional glutamate N-acetyltransferase/amino-acid acetyltransferase ArgJ [Syntrophales bacterium]
MIIPGFRFAAAMAGIKKAGVWDLALMAADEPVAAAGVFTRNRVKAAPVLVTRQRLRNGKAQAVLVNAGNANACTGEAGLSAARETSARAGELLKISEQLVLPASTGVIGQPLPVGKIKAALPDLVAGLKVEGLPDAAGAIMTTDTRPKTASIRSKIAGKEFTLAGIAKGSGMIHPDLATLLVFVFTDVAATPKVLKTLLRQALPLSFNRITVDGDTSTNDTILLMASGKAGNPLIEESGAEMAALGEAVNQVLGDLARQVVADGEGARHFFRVVVRGANTPQEAVKAAQTVALSPLVKTAMAGEDVNWGRIMAALGRSGARFDPERVDIAFGEHPVVQNGLGLGPDAEAKAQQVLKAGPFHLHINLNAGDFEDYYDTCDYTEEYIHINADYRS